jgi:excisionase family DNA binding protein
VVLRVPKNESESSFVTVAEVAGQLRVSNMTVYRLIQAGQLAAVRVGRSYRIRDVDVDRYLAEQYTQAG